MAHSAGRLVLIAPDVALTLGDPKALAPASDIGGVGGAMGAAGGLRMIMPGPARRRIDLETDFCAEALAFGETEGFCGFCHARLPIVSVIASAAKQSRAAEEDWIASSLRSSQ